MSFEKTSAELARFMKDLTDGKQEVSYAGGTVGDEFVLAPGRISSMQEICAGTAAFGKTSVCSSKCW